MPCSKGLQTNGKDKNKSMYYILGIFVVILFVLANLHYSKRRTDLRQTDLFKHTLTKEKIFLMAAALAVFLVIALQSEQGNGDLIQYYRAFRRYSVYTRADYQYIINNAKDPFYYICGLLFAHIGFSFRGWYLFIGFIYTLSIYLLVSRYSSNVYISFIVLITVGSLGFALSGLRQTLAFAFLMFSFKFLESKKIIKFMFMILIASLFHSTAIIFIFAYPLYRLKLRLRNLIILGLGSVMLILNGRFFLSGFIRFIGTDDIYSAYLDKESGLSIAGIIIFSFILVFCLCSYYLGFEDAKYRGLCNLAIASLTFRILSVTLFAEMFRVSMYFAVFDILLIAEACSCGPRNVNFQRLKTVGATLAMTSYYLVSPAGAFVNYIFK